MRGRTILKIKKAVIKSVIKSGFDGVRIKNIAKETGSSEALLFKYYKDKNHLIRSVFRDIANEFYNYIKEKVDKSDEKINAFIDSFIDFAVSKKNEFLLVLKMYQFHYDKFIKKTPKPIDILREIAPDGKYGKAMTVAFIASILTRMLEFYLNNQIDDDIEKLRKSIKEVINNIL